MINVIGLLLLRRARGIAALSLSKGMPGTSLLQRKQKVSFRWGFGEVALGADKKCDH